MPEATWCGGVGPKDGDSDRDRDRDSDSDKLGRHAVDVFIPLRPGAAAACGYAAIFLRPEFVRRIPENASANQSENQMQMFGGKAT